MNRQLIDRDNVLKGIEELKHSPFVNSHYSYVRYMMREALDVVAKLVIDAQPTVEPKQGKWIEQEDGSGWCSLCGCSIPMFIIDWQYQYDKTPYCPSCGAKLMADDEVESEGEDNDRG